VPKMNASLMGGEWGAKVTCFGWHLLASLASCLLKAEYLDSWILQEASKMEMMTDC